MKSVGYALKGLVIAWKEEFNFKIEIAAVVFTLAASVVFDLSTIEFALVILTIGLVLVTELFNTALEELCDALEPNHDPHIAKIKDISAAAVFITSLTAFIIGVIIFGSHLLAY